jgi:ATP/maltotriose-dependent transcriptional regulator MalT
MKGVGLMHFPGQSNQEIANQLGLGLGTVKIHIAKLFKKLGVRHRCAVALAGAKLWISLVPLQRLMAWRRYSD